MPSELYAIVVMLFLFSPEKHWLCPGEESEGIACLVALYYVHILFVTLLPWSRGSAMDWYCCGTGWEFPAIWLKHVCVCVCLSACLSVCVSCLLKLVRREGQGADHLYSTLEGFLGHSIGVWVSIVWQYSRTGTMPCVVVHFCTKASCKGLDTQKGLRAETLVNEWWVEK